MEKARRIEEFAGFLAARYHNVAEIGIGHFPDLAYALIEAGCDVLATDVLPFEYDKIKVILDDVTRPDLSRYAKVDLIYSMHPPPELVPYMRRLAEAISADLIIKPLSSEYPETMELMRAGNTTFFLKREKRSLTGLLMATYVPTIDALDYHSRLSGISFHPVCIIDPKEMKVRPTQKKVLPMSIG